MSFLKVWFTLPVDWLRRLGSRGFGLGVWLFVEADGAVRWGEEL